MLIKKKDNKHTMQSLVWDQKNLTKTLNLTYIFYESFLILANFDYMVDYNLTIKNHIHSSVVKLWFNNEKGNLRILIMQFMSTSKP